MTSSSAMDLSEFENDPRLFLFTSLTAGSSHIITATSRMETILKANKIPFQAIDTATDEKARRLWQRRAQQKKLPGLVKDGFVIGDLEEVEEWNEFGELKENIGPLPSSNAIPVGGGRQGVNTRPAMATSPPPPMVDGSTPTTSTSPPPAIDNLARAALPGPASPELVERNKTQSPAAAAAAKPSIIDEPPAAVETMTSAPAEKEKSINAAKEISKNHPSLNHISTSASRVHSGTATPAGKPAAAGSHGEDAEAIANEDLKDTPADEVQQLETDTSSTTATKRISSLRFEEPDKTQNQAAKEGRDAGKSVEDC